MHEDAVKPILCCCLSVEDAARLASSCSAFHAASKRRDVLGWWADHVMQVTEAGLSKRFFLMPLYLEWVANKTQIYKEVGLLTVLGRYSDPGQEQRDLLRLLYTRCESTRSLAYLCAMSRDGVFETLALLGQWCIAAGESMIFTMIAWLCATDAQLWKAPNPDAFRWWDVESISRKHVPSVGRVLSGRPPRNKIKKTWETAKTQWLALFLEEHLFSFWAPHWHIPYYVEQDLRNYADGYDPEGFFNSVCRWGRFVSFKEWHDAIRDPWYTEMSSESGSSPSDAWGESFIRCPAWKPNTCSRYALLLRHFALVIKHWHGMRYSMPALKQSLDRDRSGEGTGDEFADGCADVLELAQAWYSDPWFWLDTPSAALAAAPEAPPLVRKVLSIQRMSQVQKHAERSVMTRLRRAIFDGTAIPQLARQAGLATTKGTMELQIGLIMKFKSRRARGDAH